MVPNYNKSQLKALKKYISMEQPNVVSLQAASRLVMRLLYQQLALKALGGWIKCTKYTPYSSFISANKHH